MTEYPPGEAFLFSAFLLKNPVYGPFHEDELAFHLPPIKTLRKGIVETASDSDLYLLKGTAAPSRKNEVRKAVFKQFGTIILAVLVLVLCGLAVIGIHKIF